MTKFTERQLERQFCAMEKRRDAIRAACRNEKFSSRTRSALCRASDALTEALGAIQSETLQ